MSVEYLQKKVIINEQLFARVPFAINGFLRLRKVNHVKCFGEHDEKYTISVQIAQTETISSSASKFPRLHRRNSRMWNRTAALIFCGNSIDYSLCR